MSLVLEYNWHETAVFTKHKHVLLTWSETYITEISNSPKSRIISLHLLFTSFESRGLYEICYHRFNHLRKPSVRFSLTLIFLWQISLRLKCHLSDCVIYRSLPTEPNTNHIWSNCGNFTERKFCLSRGLNRRPSEYGRELPPKLYISVFILIFIFLILISCF
jgi:hypothetical protein